MALGVLLWLPVSMAWGIALNQTDDFEDGTVQGWKEAAQSPNPPTNMPSGGPAGASDKFMKLVSSGGESAGSRMVAFNQFQWRGNYNTAGVAAIRADVQVFTGTGHVRVAVEASSGCRWVSTVAAVVAGDGLWHTVNFDLTQMTRVGGNCALADALGSVGTLRFLSNPQVLWQGEQVAMTLGVDNITALSEIVAAEPSTWGSLKTRYE
jgi:hypothetical protein